MKIKNISNVEGLFEVIDSCSDSVELVGEDIRLNLKSQLAKYVSLAQIFSGGTGIPELELVAHNQKDRYKLIKFVMEDAKN